MFSKCKTNKKRKTVREYTTIELANLPKNAEINHVIKKGKERKSTCIQKK